MRIQIKKRFMKLPVTREAQGKTLLFYKEGKLLLDFTTRLDPADPQEYYYWDFCDYVGQDLDLEIDPHVSYIQEFVDLPPMEEIYTERWRPTVHFSSARGWINDPNGAVFYEGKYHLFFQHNPADSCWGNMSWGHAVSADLIHWTQLEDALFPDELGTVFSGSAFVDSENVTGLKENDHDPLLLYYTAAGNTSRLSAGKCFTQCMAYSTDGGLTFKKYEHNPVVPHIIEENRDPKVVFLPETGNYCMALYLTGQEYLLLQSDDLLHWQEMQRLTLPGDGECPDFYPLHTPVGKRYWIFSGASDRYLVGKIQAGKFIPVQEARSLQCRGRSYAAQTFANVPGGKVLRMGWNQTEIPNSVFNGSMCTPTEMTLAEDEGGLWLRTEPILPAQTPVPDASGANILPLPGKAQDIRLRLHLQPDTAAVLHLLGLNMEISGDALSVKNVKLPLYPKNGEIVLRLITDTHATEIYAADGRAFTCIDHMADYNLGRLSLQGNMTVLEATVTELENIWN